MGLLDGKVALVTGGAKSIGRMMCETLAAEGASIAIADIEDGAATADAIERRHGVPAMARIADVSHEAQVSSLVAAVMERFGRIDILVNNAALYATLPTGAYHEIGVDMWDRVMAVNLRGPFLMVKHVGPHMSAAGSGKIINVGSSTVALGVPYKTAYVASKGGVIALTRALARELGPSGVCVNTLAPGLTESESNLANPHQLDRQSDIVAARAIKRVQVPADLAGALLFLASPMSDFMTGQTILVDGGLAMT